MTCYYPALERNNIIDEFVLSFFKRQVEQSNHISLSLFILILLHYRESQTIRDTGSAVDAVLEKEAGDKAVQRILKWTLLFAIQTIKANYDEQQGGGKFRDIDRFEDWVYGGAGKGLIDPVKLRDLAAAAASTSSSPRYMKATSSSSRNHHTSKNENNNDSEDENTRPSHKQQQPQRIVKIVEKPGASGSGKKANVKITLSNKTTSSTSAGKKKQSNSTVTPTFGAYPVWWGHEETAKQGLSATALKEAKLNALKEKDRALYRAQLRRLEKKRVYPISATAAFKPVITSTNQLERAIDSIKVKREIKSSTHYDQ